MKKPISKVIAKVKSTVNSSVSSKLPEAKRFLRNKFEDGKERVLQMVPIEKIEKAKAYVQGKAFESDLDAIISSLQMDSVGKPVSFTEYKDRNKRVIAKLKYLRNQAGMVIGLCGSAGSKIGAKVGRGNPAVIADGAMVGSAAGVAIVGFFAGRILLKRYQSEDAIEITADLLEALPSGES